MRDLLERYAKDYHDAAGGDFQGEGIPSQRLWEGEIGEKMICIKCERELSERGLEEAITAADFWISIEDKENNSRLHYVGNNSWK